MDQNITEDLISPYNKIYIVDSQDRIKAGTVFNQMSLVLDVMKKDLEHREMDLKYSHANCKGTNKWSLTSFKSTLKISHFYYLLFCYNLLVKFAIFLKSNLLFNSFYCLFTAQ